MTPMTLMTPIQPPRRQNENVGQEHPDRQSWGARHRALQLRGPLQFPLGFVRRERTDGVVVDLSTFDNAPPSLPEPRRRRLYADHAAHLSLRGSKLVTWATHLIGGKTTGKVRAAILRSTAPVQSEGDDIAGHEHLQGLSHEACASHDGAAP
jgi:hypothetical protein